MPSEQPDDIAGPTDADLLASMSHAAQAPAAARQAWEQFYLRHAGYLYAVCLRAYGGLLGGPAGASDLVADTFRRVYQHAGAFNAGDSPGDGRGEGADPVGLRRRTRAWLGRVAQRLAQDVLRGRKRIGERLMEIDQWQQVARPDRPAGDSPRIRLVRQAIEQLTDKEQQVIRVTLQWYRPDQPHQRLPNDVAAELAETMRTTPENLRQIRHRAMKKIEVFLKARTGSVTDAGRDGRSRHE